MLQSMGEITELGSVQAARAIFGYTTVCGPPSILTARQPATASPANLTRSSVHLVVLTLSLPM